MRDAMLVAGERRVRVVSEASGTAAVPTSHGVTS